jgi:small subunit ribosomal protein S8e
MLTIDGCLCVVRVQAEAAEGEAASKSNHVQRKLAARKAELDHLLEEQFASGRLLASISSRPGQSGRADG